MANWLDKLLRRSSNTKKQMFPYTSFLRQIQVGSFYRVSNLKGNSSISNIKTQIDTMRALAEDSQISTALSYYATDATTLNSSGQIIWATATDPNNQEVAELINLKFKEWNINRYARDHILELATIGNLYLPTTKYYREGANGGQEFISLDMNTIRDDSYEIVASTKIPPENCVHLCYQGMSEGYGVEKDGDIIRYDENAIIHFTLGGLLGDYTLPGKDSDGNEIEFDIQFGQPLMAAATQPTQTLNLLEDALVLSSLTRIVRFVNVDCGNAEEEEIQATLQEIKDMIEQQLSINTATGDAQSYVNPQSPNNLIYLPKINGQNAIDILDMNMAEATDADNKLLQYYQDKKLSVLGVPKEAMNFSSAEGLGGAGAVMSQRSALYGNSLERIETAYKEGWRSAFNKYFEEHGFKGFVDKFELHMNPIITQMSTVSSERRDSAINQASSIVDLLKTLGIEEDNPYREALVEILSEALPKIGASVNGWRMNVLAGEEAGPRL